MAAASEEWSVDANEAVKVSLVQPAVTSLSTIHQFHPKFTYPIFGEEERIFGYKGLEINLKFAAHDLSPNVSISYRKRFPPVGRTVALDLNETLKEFLPDSAFQKPSDFEQGLRKDSKARDYRPPGKLIHSYQRRNRTFEIWAGSLFDPAVRAIIDRIQIFVSLFIEAGTFIATDDVDWTLKRWEVYFLYENLGSRSIVSPYCFAGYATTYRFWSYQKLQKSHVVPEAFPLLEPIAPTQLPSRLRISQFLILPPYQSAGHGSALYQSIYSEVMADPTIHELTIEDPSEECDKLRDINDWGILQPIFESANIKIINTPFAPAEKIHGQLPTSRLLEVEKLKVIRASTKIAGRQFARQLEMYLLAQVGFSHRSASGSALLKLRRVGAKASDANDRTYYWWRLIVKQRITKKNKDLLQQIDAPDRIVEVEKSLLGQQDEYEGLLLYLAMMAEKEEMRNGNGGSTEGSSREHKRKIVDDDDDDDEDSITSEEPTAKKSRP